MRRIVLLCALTLLSQVICGQTAVDSVAKMLDSRSTLTLDMWKVSPDLKSLRVHSGDPTAPDFDVTDWDDLQLNQSIYPDSCWLRSELVLPDRVLGQPLEGKIRFLVSLDDYGFLWVNGKSMGRFPWDGEFVLTEQATPGQRFVLAIKAINTGGPLRLLRAEVVLEKTASLQQEIRDIALSFRVGQKLLSFDTYQTNARKREDPGVDRSMDDRDEKVRLNTLLQSLARQVNITALERGDLDGFKHSLNAMRSKLTPVREFCREFTLYFDANAHIDAAWLWRENETIEVCNNTFRSVLNMMNQRPDFTYTQSSAAYYSWMEQLYPDLFQEIGRRVKDGRWEIVGGMWVEPDCNIPSGESWARHLLYGKRYFKEKFDVDVTIGWNPDSFGYNWNMPSFFRKAGIDAFVTQKIGWNDANVFPYRLFWWQSPDSSRILGYFPFDYVNTVDDPYRLVDWLRQFEANTGVKKMMVLFGVGDHGGGPSLQMLDRIEHLRQLDLYPSIEFGTALKYINWLKEQNLDSLPIWDDELYLEYHRGTFTTQAKMKEFNRRSEVLLTNAEKLIALASRYGMKVDMADLQDAWRKALFNQFHDILPGSSIREVYIDATEAYREAQAVGNHEIDKALDHLVRNINTSTLQKGMPIVVFNPLSWNRTDLVTVDVPIDDTLEYAVYDQAGKEVACQIVAPDRYRRQLLFIAKDVPSVGYTCYELRRQKPHHQGGDLRISNFDLENAFLRVIVNTRSGWITEIADKRHSRGILAGPGNELQLLEDVPAAWDAWNIGWTGVKYPLTYRRAEIVEKGPVRVVLRLYHDFLKPGAKKEFPTEDFPSSFFVQDIVLHRDLDRVDFVTRVDWWEDKTMLKVAFPLVISDTLATYEIPYGSIQRSTQMHTSWEKARQEVPGQRWADVSTSRYGVSLLNRAKYGYDIKGNLMRLSLLRSPRWPDPTADRGKHTIEYALYPHKGTWREGLTVQRGYEFNNPFLAVLADSHKGSLPLTYSFVSIEPSNLVLSSIKIAGDGNGWVVQWYEALGRDAKATVTFAQAPKEAILSNFLEEDLARVPIDGRSFVMQTRANSIQTIRVHF